MNGSPFYTVEPHEEVILERQNDYLDSSVASQLTQTWAYGDTDSINGQDDTGKTFDDKMLDDHASKVTIDIVHQEEQNGNSCVTKDMLMTGCPLFTSEKMIDDVDNESSSEVVMAIVDNDLGIEEAESCEIDVNSFDFDEDSKNGSPYQHTLSEPYVPVSSPSFFQSESTDFDTADTSMQGSSNSKLSYKDENRNELCGEAISKEKGYSVPMKTVKGNETDDNQELVSYL